MQQCQRRVLIVDDERVIADTLAVIFSSSGYEARAAYSAEQAAEIVALWPPDLAILDVILPGMNGIEFAISLRTQLASCQVLLFSGQAATADLLAEAETKGHSFEILAKPVHPTAMLQSALQLLTATQTQNASQTGTSPPIIPISTGPEGPRS